MSALWDSGLLQRALVELVLLGAVCAPLGVWVAHLRYVYAAESLAHAMLPGLVLAVLVGAPLLLGAVGGVLGAAVLVALAARDRRIGGELAVAVVVTGLLGLGAALALSPDIPAGLTELLFGDPLGVAAGDLAAAAALGLVLVAALAVGHRRLSLVTFDPVAAPSLGSRPDRVELAVLIGLAIALVAAVQGLGNLLVVALIVAPAAAAMRIAGSLRGQLTLAAALGAGSGAGGLALSLWLDVAAGASVALVAVACFALAGVVRPAKRAPRRAPSAIEAMGR
ncbi:MAG TPA: metal ABC transporter permease [Solirubrobacteraceae bacterium]|nr:metal ABC transporter permease [Solirubrobacteraceae bacterium]